MTPWKFEKQNNSIKRNEPDLIDLIKAIKKDTSESEREVIWGHKLPHILGKN